jgi:hypothetical protein
MLTKERNFDKKSYAGGPMKRIILTNIIQNGRISTKFIKHMHTYISIYIIFNHKRLLYIRR